MLSNQHEKKVVTRFPPSPTGFLHIGRVRTLLFNYFFTKQNNGKMIFRLEDTDKTRSKKEYENDIIENLRWLGVEYDEGPFRQSERTDIYKKYLKQLIHDKHAYISKEEELESETKRAEVIRFKNPNKKITFNDAVRGEISFDTSDLGDFVIAKSSDEPLYHLAVVVDDFEMGITHVIRGDDGISNTPRQILIQEAIGAPMPTYAHIPLILSEDRAKLSGRHGAVSLTEYRNAGYLPEAVINYLALLGWNPGTDQEIMTLDEIIAQFSLSKVQKAGAIFDEDKLLWFNKEHMRRLPNIQNRIINEIARVLPEINPRIAEAMSETVLDKICIFGDINKMNENGEFEYFISDPALEKNKIAWKNDAPEIARKNLKESREILSRVDETNFNASAIKDSLWQYAEKAGKGSVLWPVRYALSGKEKSPDPFVLAGILGKKTCLERIDSAIKILTH
ncbi:MAG: glutamate--tRNA ligase [Candidatus Taylorbacteria bacterium RIFCSPLOWO2_12_FULL_43_20]|uniref:Glutamate--tRNA ligase n=1 Tax=Candidatus Taylorbacteria bacterium RIFCSPLOWO2_12_FULL_43_20 TaxID=1802332 RepID=A0A1G2P3Q9_9BACT|nr:MAG: glutamate--tRNA ligase [Candidatus Taylorbacteria bacterium RIFCSPHIGHO2_01_FULL_43_120]OHA23017.1 MAG: glutamate--tRNA ligase [Candidatus Taylorbacteria bacterium RIFCSPHIGHO2_02_FULL_43_55]OHA30133.1 MAG: glutamate--tRNA ligase [Candidatus Taylorbacteria bacterium RIFCSPHIGHO2_12_FULL_42_34]OHA30731.1 MAG: glutamate--tRNA ligase [Candidatus Taylorbacteria bacterium RIFCSPLOWO2_01_FULL_43_83]OHA39604.1 MAG: glutamate--tRNA ligase [Candidatus Taylorbacteria bacterium RIFCSPLOWO2_02_FULL